MAKYKQIAVLGLGRFGQSVVRALSDSGCDVLACDKDMDIVQEMSQYTTHAAQIDVTDENALNTLGLGNFDVVIIGIGSNLESSVLATIIAKESGAKYVMTKAKDMTQKRILERLGADRVVMPEWEMGIKIAASLTTENLIDYINLSDEYGVAEVGPSPEWVNESLKHANIRAKTGLNVVAIKRGKKIIVSPSADEVIDERDILVVVGRNADMRRMQR